MTTTNTLHGDSQKAKAAGPLNIFGDELWVRQSGQETGGVLAVMEDFTEPGQGPPLHRHGREDESFYVVEGEFLFEVDGKQIHARAGEAVFAPKGTAHTFQNTGATRGRLLIMVHPAGLEDFFADIARASEGIAEPDLTVVVPIFRNHGLELLGPPIGARASR